MGKNTKKKLRKTRAAAQAQTSDGDAARDRHRDRDGDGDGDGESLIHTDRRVRWCIVARNILQPRETTGEGRGSTPSRVVVDTRRRKEWIV